MKPIRATFSIVLALAALVAQSGATSLIDYQRILYLTPPLSYANAQGLFQGSDGRLYGTLHGSGSNAGALFRVEPGGGGYSVIYSFSTHRPSGVIEGNDGRLYGTVAGPLRSHDSALFRVDRDGSHFTVLRSFSTNGPRSGVIQDTEGWLYGTTTGDGFQNAGSIFKISTNGTGFQVLHQFAGAANDDGMVPGALTLGRDGLLYGCTFYGGFPADLGTVFRMGRDGLGFVLLHRFDGTLQGGQYPAAARPLLEGSDGSLYGAANGGSRRAGILFRLNKAGGGFQVIHEFEGEDGTGDSPLGGLVEWCDGALYGATYEGGIDGAGTLFRLNKDGSAFVVLHVYIDTPNPGATEGTPRTSLVPASDGKLYGLTSGGSVAEGTLYRISPRPVLRIEADPDGMILSWPACPEGYVLEQSNNLGGIGDWTRVGIPDVAVGSLRLVVLPRSEDRRFFRLVRH